MRNNINPRLFTYVILIWSFMVPGSGMAAAPGYGASGLLFHLSGDQGFTADVAGGVADPTFKKDVALVRDGSHGPWFRCENSQLMAYRAPGNIYAQRGTLAFFWRPRDPVGETPFPVFRVGYADHTSWDMVWLRIDYNGHGFDAFVTDINLARHRVSYRMTGRPAADKWVHLALSWDEIVGVRFYVDGTEVGHVDTTAVFDAGLDQFGPHSRIISPYQVQSAYNFMRGGDLDELCIFNVMLPDRSIRALAAGNDPATVPLIPDIRPMFRPGSRNEWRLRYGWNRTGDLPPLLSAPVTHVRKVEVREVYDHKQWCWKATDGIRETTWPGVYNRSRLPGRNDYFQLPDWNCYSVSGRSVTFTLPDEDWNHVEIAGGAYGHLYVPDRTGDETLRRVFYRFPAQERTVHRLPSTIHGGSIRFDNERQETPIGELQVYHVEPGGPPEGAATLDYRIDTGAATDYPVLDDLRAYIDGRFFWDERTTVVALPQGAPRHAAEPDSVEFPLPLVHILIPCDFREGNMGGAYSRYSYTWENMNAGLAGIVLELPGLDAEPMTGNLLPLNIRVMDPVWPNRTLFDFSCSVRPGEPRTIWMDTRDRILPNGKSLWLTIAASAGDFDPEMLDGARLRLVFTDRTIAAVEHEADRFTQVRDNMAHMVEERPNSNRFDLYRRFSEDITDLLRVNPDHLPGRYYWSYMNPEQGWPPYEQPQPPPGVPLWAFRQSENVKRVGEFIHWWIDGRQIANGEFGGGLSDDSDLTNQWPGAGLMGITPDKITDSLRREMGAIYANGMIERGLPAIQADELHGYEEGINVIPQMMLLDYGDPVVVERLMETAGALERITGINDRGERQIRSSYYGATAMADEDVWARSKLNYSYLMLHPAIALVEYNGHPAAQKYLIELADGLMAHMKRDEHGRSYLPAEISFPSGEDSGRGLGSALYLLWAAWRWTGDEKYLQPMISAIGHGDFSPLRDIPAGVSNLPGLGDDFQERLTSGIAPDSGRDYVRHLAWQLTRDTVWLDGLYADQVQYADQTMYMMTEGQWWADRVGMESRELQRARLGGVALWRGSTCSGHAVSWRFRYPARAGDVAILVPGADGDELEIVAHNLSGKAVSAVMTAWDVNPGDWRLVTGIDTDGDTVMDTETGQETIALERSGAIPVHFEPHTTTVLQLERIASGTPYWERPDLGIGEADVTIGPGTVTVRVHSLGSVTTPAASVVLVDRGGAILGAARVPAIEAPLDFQPRTAEAVITVPRATSFADCTIELNPRGDFEEVTRLNNIVRLP